MAITRSGWKPSPFDARDLIFSRSDNTAMAEARRTLILEHPFPVQDQGNIPCCVSCAVSVGMEILDTQRPPQVPLSPLFNYYVTRPNINNLIDLTIRDGLHSAVVNGISDLAHHAPNFDRNGALQRPLPAAFDDAARRRLVGINPITNKPEYYLLPDINRVSAWRISLSRGMPIMVGFWLTTSYQKLSPNNSVLNAFSSVPPRAGHAVPVIGFDDERSMFLVKDSRGVDFGDNGHWWLPYQLAETRLVAEAWALGRINY
jgi:hypothetical protein